MSILSNCIHKIDVNHTYQGSANTWIYTGASITIPPNSFFVISASTSYNYSAVKNISIDTSSAGGGYVGNVTQYYGSIMSTYAYFTGSNSATFYIKAMIQSALTGSNTNTAYIRGFYITLPN